MVRWSKLLGSLIKKLLVNRKRKFLSSLWNFFSSFNVYNNTSIAFLSFKMSKCLRNLSLTSEISSWYKTYKYDLTVSVVAEYQQPAEPPAVWRDSCHSTLLILLMFNQKWQIKICVNNGSFEILFGTVFTKFLFLFRWRN